jgi:hypothetical protein
VTDDAINRIVDFAHVRAPFLFNYVAPSIRLTYDTHGVPTGWEDLWVTCAPVPDSPLPGVPKYRRLPPFGLPGITVDLPYCIQIVDVTIDFHPSDQLTLPDELQPPLKAQRFGLKAQGLFGLACIPHAAAMLPTFGLVHVRQLPVLPVTEFNCFVLDLYAVGHLTVASTPQAGQPYPLQQIRLEVDGLEIVDIQPRGLEHAVECYLRAILRGHVLPHLVLGLEELVVNTLGIELTPHLTLGLPNNPAIEQDELRVWLDVEVGKSGP